MSAGILLPRHPRAGTIQIMSKRRIALLIVLVGGGLLVALELAAWFLHGGPDKRFQIPLLERTSELCRPLRAVGHRPDARRYS